MSLGICLTFVCLHRVPWAILNNLWIIYHVNINLYLKRKFNLSFIQNELNTSSFLWMKRITCDFPPIDITITMVHCSSESPDLTSLKLPDSTIKFSCYSKLAHSCNAKNWCTVRLATLHPALCYRVWTYSQFWSWRSWCLYNAPWGRTWQLKFHHVQLTGHKQVAGQRCKLHKESCRNVAS